jgi:hypothetical protein
VTQIAEHCIKPANGVRKKGRAKVLVSRGQTEVFVSQELSDGVNIRALHSHPTRCRVPQIVKAKIENLFLLAEAAKSNTHLVRRDARKHFVGCLCFGAPSRFSESIFLDWS